MALDTPPPPPAANLRLPRLQSPSVSIVICNFNYAQYLEEAIASALGQTMACQVIVVDDGSTDGSRHILSRLGGDAAEVLVLLQHNGGQAAAYNHGLAHCTGDIVIFLDADDTLAPHAASQVGRCFDAQIVKVHFRLMLVDSAGRPTGGAIPSALSHGDVGRRLIDHGLLYASSPGSGNAYRRSALLQLFPIPVDSADRVGADFFAIYGVAAFGEVAACGQLLGCYRLHARPVRSEAIAPVFFGNAAIDNDEAAKVATRYARLRELIAERTAGRVAYAARFLDFSVQKSTFASQVLGRAYWAAVFGSGGALLPLLRALWLHPDYRARRKLGLTVWALLVLLAPRPTGVRLARFVCDPASRAA